MSDSPRFRGALYLAVNIAKELRERVALPMAAPLPSASCETSDVSQAEETDELRNDKPVGCDHTSQMNGNMSTSPPVADLPTPAATRGSTPSHLSSKSHTPEFTTPRPSSGLFFSPEGSPEPVDLFVAFPRLDTTPPVVVPTPSPPSIRLDLDKQTNITTPCSPACENLAPITVSTPPHPTSSSRLHGSREPPVAPAKGFEQVDSPTPESTPTESDKEPAIDNECDVSPSEAGDAVEGDDSGGGAAALSDTPMMSPASIVWPDWFVDDYGELLKGCRNDRWSEIVVLYAAMEAHLEFPTSQVSFLDSKECM